MTKSNLKRVYFSLQFHVININQGRNLRLEPEAGGVLPRDGTTFNGLGLPTPITSQESTLQTCLWASVMEAFAQLRVLLPRYVSNLCQVDIKLDSTAGLTGLW